MSLRSQNTALLLVDIQDGLDETAFYGGKRNNPRAEQNAATLLNSWRSKGLPVFHVRHSSTNPDSPLYPAKKGFAIKEVVQPMPGEPVITKNTNSAFMGTDLKDRLKKAGSNTVVVVGLTTNHCVSSTVRMSANLGLSTYVVADATAAFENRDFEGKVLDADTMHRVTLASLQGEFATVLDTQAILAILE